ncbi:MAG TPA: DegT/DnrJ/EryC1/StrS family aminotransferase, partial [Candidatus Marinimicrobia bacterium]|nr:DegT/DnrJ/EryC1/StrS family aminotransferase [Candidatus Neomarinimicrobiota bacterium]
LKREYATLKHELLPALEAVLESTAFIRGPEVIRFNKRMEELLGVKHHIGCANGTDALKVALMALGIGPGDEVITSPFTFVATAEVIAFLGATPVFIDIEADSYLMDPELIEEAITPRTKAIIPVHLFGQMADMKKINAIAQKHNLKVIEDSAQAILASQNGILAGCSGDVGTISYFPSKNLGAYGDAGGLITNDEELAKKIAMIANHGSKVRYEHHLIGVNSRLDSVQAAILNVKAPYLSSWIKKRQQVAHWYEANLHPSIICPKTAPENIHTYHQYTIRTSHRQELMRWLANAGIASAIYYPIPLDEQPGFKALSVSHHTENSRQACKEVLSLPVSPWINEGEIVEICQRINQFFKK